MSRTARESRDDGALPPLSPAFSRLFGAVARRELAAAFAALRLSRSGGVPRPGGLPLLVVANHPSWWDPLVFLLLARDALGVREVYGPMDAAQLRRYRFFRRLGAFGIERGERRGAATFLAAGRAALRRPGASLWVTAQGAFADPRRRPLELQPGVGHLAASCGPAVAVPLALEYPFWDERRPEALARFGEPIAVEPGDRRGAAAWNELFAARLEICQDRLRDEAMRRDPGLFDTLLSGRRGTAALYGLLRRVRAGWRGERSRAGHGPRGGG